ncbi:MOSC domain-containing protein, partial [Pseudonocardia sp.]|uniref:MOSC domain-containing protein n=1 Tax=Pseudonocardia sp. TaxID=60912 RepID=UPI003D143853
GFGLTARRLPALLWASARLVADRAEPAVEIVLPDGTVTVDDAVLSDWLGRPVALRAAEEVVERRYENPSDTETEAPASWAAFRGAEGAFHDSVVVTLVSLATLAGQPQRRFRANVVLAGGEGEDDLVGRVVRIGEAAVDVAKPVSRCVMVTRAQPGGIAVDREILRRIHRERDGLLAVGGSVTRPGTVRVGDELIPA